MNPDRNPDGSCAADGLVGIVWYAHIAIGWTLSWALYFPGLATTYIMYWADWTAPVLFPLGSWFMGASSRVQDWCGGYGAWEDSIEVTLEDDLNTTRYGDEE